MVFQDNNWIALKRHDLLSDRIYQVYSRYIPCIYYAYTMRWSLASRLSCPSALGSFRTGLPSELFSLGRPHEAGAIQSSTTRCWSRKPAPPWGRASTIGTAALKSVLLPAAVLMWNSWGCISVQKAWNEWNWAEEVLSPPNVESGNRQICPVHHGSKRGIPHTQFATPECSGEPWREWCAPRTVPRTADAACPSGKMSEHWSQSISSKRWEETVYGASEVPRPWSASDITVFHMCILLVYQQYRHVIFI